MLGLEPLYFRLQAGDVGIKSNSHFVGHLDPKGVVFSGDI